MKKLTSFLLAAMFVVASFGMAPIAVHAAQIAQFQQVRNYSWGYVHGYYRGNGTYVSPHYRRTH